MLTRYLLRHRASSAYAALHCGNPEPAVRAFSSNGRFVFPGTSIVAADVSGRDAIREWFTAFAYFRPRFEVLDVACAGPPWNIRGTIRFRDHIGEDYVNEGVQYVRVKWGRIVLDRIYLDTELVRAWADRYEGPWTTATSPTPSSPETSP